MGGVRRLAELAAGLTPIRVVRTAAVRFAERRGWHMAASLGFQTLVAFVPVSLFTVGILGYVIPEDADSTVTDFLATFLVPEFADRVTTEILTIVRSTNLAALGWVGAAGTYLALFLIVRNIKSCLNDLGFRSSRSRFLKRIGWVALVALLLPLVGVMVVREAWVFARLPSVVSSLRPYVSSVLLLFLVYRFLPDRGPSTPASILSAAVVGLLLEIEKIGVSYYFGLFHEVYAAIYGTLFFLPVLLAWLYISWSLILSGATLAGALDEVKGLRRDTRPADPA